MKLHVIFGHAKETYEGEHAPEVLDCWDEYSVALNPEGFDEQLAKAKSLEDYDRIAVVIVNVDFDKVMDALYPNDV